MSVIYNSFTESSNLFNSSTILHNRHRKCSCSSFTMHTLNKSKLPLIIVSGNNLVIPVQKAVPLIRMLPFQEFLNMVQ